jgi:TRAP-type C4-dicarboxylate transport system permease small subunit
MKRLYTTVGKTLYGTGFLEYLCATVISILVLITFANVVLRYFFNSPVVGIDELALFVFVWAAYAGALIAFKRHRHYSVALLADLLPPLPRAVLDAVTQLVVMGILLIMIFYAYRVNVLLQFQRSPSLEIPIYFAYAAFPIMSIAMMVYAIVDFIELIRVGFLGLEPIYKVETPSSVETS